jgi:prophage DNA circulation protein
MSEWRDRRQVASFRGVPFWVDTDSVPVGRRTQVHEYPQRDQPYVEDLGRTTRRYQFAGFVIGDDCLAQRDRLLAALDTPGPGELVHPWFGRMTVTAGECEVAHARNELGVVRFSLLFVDSMLEFPVQSPNTRRQLVAHEPTLFESIKKRFSDAMAPVNLARQRINAIRTAVSGVYAFGINFLKPLTSLASDLDSLVYSVVNAPDAFAASLLSDIRSIERTFSGYGADGTIKGVSSKSEALASLQESASIADDPEVRAVQVAVIGLIQDAALLDILLDLAELPVAGIVRAADPATLDIQLAQQGSSVVVSGVTRSTDVATGSVPVSDDIIAVRDAVSEALWSVAGSSPPAHFSVLSDTRLAVDRHLTEVARSGVWLRTYRPLDNVPSLVLAHLLYGDATRSSEIVARNRVRHPGFVPATDLQIAKS